MADWKLAPCLDVFNKELERIAPNRDHASDGTIGDAAHQGRESDHNPDENGIVCATDRDKDLHAAFTMWDVVNYLVVECKKPNDVGKDRGRLNYLIYDGWIFRADTGWMKERYTGVSPHTEHLHASCEHDLHYVNDTRTWGLVERFGDTVSKQDVIDAFKDPAGQAAFRTMLATAYADETGIQIYNKANDENPKEVKRLGDYTSGAPGTATDRIENKIDTLTDAVTALTEAIRQHAAGILEARPLQ